MASIPSSLNLFDVSVSATLFWQVCCALTRGDQRICLIGDTYQHVNFKNQKRLFILIPNFQDNINPSWKMRHFPTPFRTYRPQSPSLSWCSSLLSFTHSLNKWTQAKGVIYYVGSAFILRSHMITSDLAKKWFHEVIWLLTTILIMYPI